jgi:hypothetical protein
VARSGGIRILRSRRRAALSAIVGFIRGRDAAMRMSLLNPSRTCKRPACLPISPTGLGGSSDSARSPGGGW